MSQYYLNNDDALDWCLRYNVEIEPEGGNGKVVKLRYYRQESLQKVIIIYKEAETLVKAVDLMIEEIGDYPLPGSFKK